MEIFDPTVIDTTSSSVFGLRLQQSRSLFNTHHYLTNKLMQHVYSLLKAKLSYILHLLGLFRGNFAFFDMANKPMMRREGL